MKMKKEDIKKNLESEYSKLECPECDGAGELEYIPHERYDGHVIVL